MNMSNAAVKTAFVVVTNVLETGTAFAILVENAEQAFLPKSLIRAVPFEQGDTLKAVLIPNPSFEENGSRARWMAIRVSRTEHDYYNVPAPPAPEPVLPGFMAAEPPVQEPEPVEEDPLTEEEVLSAVKGDTLWALEDIVRAIYDEWGDEEYAEVKALVGRLHYAGKLSRVEVRVRGGMKRASVVYYAREGYTLADLRPGAE